MSARYRITWLEFQERVARVAKQINASNWQPEVILAVARGGLVPAAMLAHALGVKTVVTVTVTTYEGEERASEPDVNNRDANLLQTLNMGMGDIRVLIVDDVWDTGATMQFLAEQLPRARKCCVTVKHKQGLCDIPRVHYLGGVYPADKWLEFPWEVPR